MPTSTAKILNGKIIAEEIKKDLHQKITKAKRRPGLATILVGDDPASALYVKLKEKACHDVGIDFHKYICNLDCFSDISEKELLEMVKFLNKDKEVNGILIQLPLPKTFHTQKIINAIDPKKDVDGFHPKNKTILPPTVGAVIELLKSVPEIKKATPKKRAEMKTLVVIKSDVFTARLKKHLSEFGLVNVIQKTSIPKNSKDFDIIIIGIGQAASLKKPMVKNGAIVIDIGINKKKNQTVGDVDPKVAEVAGYLSPVPGGVGPLTVACLLRNVFEMSK